MGEHFAVGGYQNRNKGKAMDDYRQIEAWQTARRTVCWTVFGLCLLVVMLAGPAPALNAQQPNRTLIRGNISENRLFTLHGNTRPEANAKNDRGKVSDQFPLEHMGLLLRRPPERELALDHFIDNLTDPSSADFHHWLTAAELGISYGPTQTDIDTVAGWLQSHGFTLNALYPNRVLIDFSGTAGQVYKAFHTEIHQLDVGGARHIANMSDPQIPSALAEMVVGVVSLNDFRGHAGLSAAGARSGYTFPTLPFPPFPPYLVCLGTGRSSYDL